MTMREKFLHQRALLIAAINLRDEAPSDAIGMLKQLKFLQAKDGPLLTSEESKRADRLLAILNLEASPPPT